MSLFGNVRVARKKKIVESIVELWGQCGQQNTVPVSGRSMLPLLESGDQLKVQHGQNHVGVGDVITFYKDDMFVAHRIIKIKKKQNRHVIISKGDNAPQFDSPLRLQEIVGRVIAVERDGKIMATDTLSCKVLGKIMVAKTHVREKLLGMHQLENIGKLMGWRHQFSNFILRTIQFTLKVLIKIIRPYACQFKH